MDWFFRIGMVIGIEGTMSMRYTYVYDEAGNMGTVFEAFAFFYRYDETAKTSGESLGYSSSHSPGIDDPPPLYMEEGATDKDFSYHLDALGSVRSLTDSDGSTAVSYTYTPYGEMTTTDGTDDDAKVNHNTFTARDYETSFMMFYRSRFYGNRMGRFFSKDSFPWLSKMPLSINKYSYTYGNPTNRIDFNGESPRYQSSSLTDENNELLRYDMSPSRCQCEWSASYRRWSCNCSHTNVFIETSNSNPADMSSQRFMARWVSTGVDRSCQDIFEDNNDEPLSGVIERQLQIYLWDRCQSSIHVFMDDSLPYSYCSNAHFNQHGFNINFNKLFWNGLTFDPSDYIGQHEWNCATMPALSLHELSHTVTINEQWSSTQYNAMSECTAEACENNKYPRGASPDSTYQEWGRCQYFRYQIPPWLPPY